MSTVNLPMAGGSPTFPQLSDSRQRTYLRWQSLRIEIAGVCGISVVCSKLRACAASAVPDPSRTHSKPVLTCTHMPAAEMQHCF